jgi:hypothetical protein
MGRVWAARDEMLARDVAVKELVPPPGLREAELGDLRERTLREARAIARLAHRNVVRIFDIVHDGGLPWIVMELVPSRSLFEAIDADGPMAPDRAARIGLDVLAALRAAHREGLLHRDVKPANVLLADGRVVLTDFGLATLAGDASMTGTGVVLGSPSYLAPERALDGEVGPAADLWSLGATLYAAVEGSPPYSRSTPMATLAALATELPRPPRQAGVLGPVLDGLLHRDPANRIDAETAERLLRTAAAGRMPETATIAPPVAVSPGKRRRLIAAGAVVVLGLAAIAVRPLLINATAGDQARTPAIVWSNGPQVAAPAGRPSLPADVATPTTRTTPSRPARTTGPPVSPSVSTRAGTGQGKPTTPPVAVGHPMVNMATGHCIDVPDGAGTTADLQMWDCQGVNGQRFSFAADGTMRVLGKCVQIRGTANGSRLRLATCTGSSAQRFGYNAADDLVNVQTDKCVDVPDSSAANGVTPQIWDCTGNGNQKWQY